MVSNFKLSVSKTKSFNLCKKQYEFNYILKLPKLEKDYLVFGSFCHKVLDVFHTKYINGDNSPYNIVMKEAFRIAIDEFKDKITPEMKVECKEIFNKYLQNISKNKLNVIAVEKKFEFSITENIILNGAIDRIQIDDDNVVHVADYKTTKNKKYLKDDWFQLLTYAFIIYTENPEIKKVRASYILLRHDFELITTEFHINDILKVKDKYIEYANQMMTEKEFLATPNNLCPWCDFVTSCDSGKEKLIQLKPSLTHGEVNW